MTDIEYLDAFLKKNIEKYDLEIISNKSVGGKAIFRASIDNVDGGNYCTSGWEYNLGDTFTELVKELKKVEK